MRVLVTGANGYIGSAVIVELLAHGHTVTGLVRSESGAATVRALGAAAEVGALDALAVIAGHVRTHDATIHTAFFRGPGFPAAERAALDAIFSAAPAGHTLVYTSGSWVYGERGDAVVAEDAPTNPIPLVAWRVEHDELVLQRAAAGLRTVVIRPAVVYGGFERGIVGGLVVASRSGPVRIVGDGANRWPTVRADALAELYRRALEHPSARGIYNATCGPAVRYVDVARAASRAGSTHGAVEHITLEAARTLMGPYADALALDLQISSEKAARELGWHPNRPSVLEELATVVVP